MSKFNDIQNIIAEASDYVDFADFGDGVSDEWIMKAESRLGLKLPDSYKWWLKNYSGGEIYGEEIYSIYEQDFDTVIGGEIVYKYELNKTNDSFADNMLVICETNDDTFYFSLINTENDSQVYSLKNKKIYANDFIDFLRRRITEIY